MDRSWPRRHRGVAIHHLVAGPACRISAVAATTAGPRSFVTRPIQSCIGVESKRYEPFRGNHGGTYSSAYWRPVWGNDMGSFERVRDRLADGSLAYECLDVVQLVKHAFGLRTQVEKCKKSPVLLYLYAESQSWPDGRAIHQEMRQQHRSEMKAFAREARGAKVRFEMCSYEELLVHRHEQMIHRAPWNFSLLQAIQVHHPNESVH